MNTKFLKDPIFWAKFLGYAIPLAFLGYVLYINYLPFGYSKMFSIDVGAQDDTKVDEFYLEPSTALSERKIDAEDKPYRDLNGLAAAVFKPSVVLKDAHITVETTNPNISFIPPYFDFNPASTTWDYSWDFTKGLLPEFKNTKVFYFDGTTYFDGTSRMELPSSTDMFESGPFTVYAEWTPVDDSNDSQEIVGHYNWELTQNKTNITFQTGRMNNATGTIFRVTYPIDTNFFNKKHSATGIYNPGEDGYLELFIDNTFANRTYFGTSTIWAGYNGKRNLTFGKSGQGSSKFFKGGIDTIKIINKNILVDASKIEFDISTTSSVEIPFISTASTTLHQIILHASQR